MENPDIASELEFYRRIAQKRQFEADLAEIRAVYPQETAAEISQLGSDYVRLRAAGVSNLAAYNAATAARAAAAAPPAEIGPVAGGVNGEKTYYSSGEVDRLPAGKLDDPGVMKNVLRSMGKWRKPT